jgi:glycine/D-amino acid oxidase-like deaminating enzyme
MRNSSDKAFTTGTASALARHVGGRPSLIDEDQVVGIHGGLALTPSPTCGRYVRAALLGGMKRLFLSVS